jgi:GntR family transcriptional regulator
VKKHTRKSPARTIKRHLNGAAVEISSATPIYVQLIMHFRHQISSGKWKINQIIPAMEELAQEFNVTAATIRQAIGFLQREGLLSSRRGRGTEVVAVPKARLWEEVLPSSWDELLETSDHIAGDFIDLARPTRLPDLPQSERGNLAPNYQVIRRLLRWDGLPFLVGMSYIDRRIIDEIGSAAFQGASGYRAIETSKRFNATHGQQTLTLVTADAEIAFLLEIPLNAPIVNVFRWIYDDNDTLIYQSEGLFRADFAQVARQLK